MAYVESSVRAYVDQRFPRASASEREKLVQDWLTKDRQANGIADDFERRVEPLRGLRVLDSGSGNGGISLALAARGALVSGVEVEKELFDIAQAEAKERGSSATFTLYDGSALPFPDGTFDAAVSVSVTEHVDDPTAYYREILRVLKPGGALYLGVPNRLNPKETHTGLWFLTYLPRPLAQAYLSLMHHNPLEDNNLHFYTYWDIRRFLAESGSPGRSWRIREEKGQSANPLVRLAKAALRAVGIPHQALLPHVMLVVEAKEMP